MLGRTRGVVLVSIAAVHVGAVAGRARANGAAIHFVMAVRAARRGLREYRTRRQSDGRAKQRGDDSILLHVFPLEGCEGTFLDARTVRNEVEK
jgi:hypothetical protein